MHTLEDANKYQQKYRINHKYRPLFHVTAPIGWINDPNGFSEYNGKKHLFYQYHPYSTEWGPMHWGHVTTDDFISWEEQSAVLAPDHPYDSFGCFSGSALEKDGKHYLVYTGVVLKEGEEGFLEEVQTQCLARGDGNTYEKYPGNPVIDGSQLPEGYSRNHFRDPKVWQDEDGKFHLVVGNLDENNLGQILLFESDNLTDWNLVSTLKNNENGRYGIMWECPDFFEIDNKHMLIVSPQDMLAGEDDIISGNHSIYFIGNFNEITNELEQKDAKLLDYGSEFYAPQTMLTEDGRRIMIAWLASWDHNIKERGRRWNGMMTLPRELVLKDNNLYQIPVKELEKYWTKEFIQKDLEILNNYYADELKGQTIDMEIEILEGDFEKFIIHFNHNSDFDTQFIYDKNEEKIIFDRTHSGIRRDINNKREFKLIPTEEPVKFRLILDRYSAELFINDGLQTLSAALSPIEEADQIYLECEGNCKINLKFHQIEVEEEDEGE